MNEVAVAGCICCFFAAGVVAKATLPWWQLLRLGVGGTAFGLVLSLVGGGVYHWQLRRVLAPRNALTPRWWWRPTSLHPLLQAEERCRVLPWFVLGAAGFVAAMLGCSAVLLAAFGGKDA